MRSNNPSFGVCSGSVFTDGEGLIYISPFLIHNINFKCEISEKELFDFGWRKVSKSIFIMLLSSVGFKQQASLRSIYYFDHIVFRVEEQPNFHTDVSEKHLEKMEFRIFTNSWEVYVIWSKALEKRISLTLWSSLMLKNKHNKSTDSRFHNITYMLYNT